MLYDELKSIYTSGLDLHHFIQFAPPQGAKSEYVVYIIPIRLGMFRPYHHFDTLDAIRALYERYEEDDWHARFHEIHARAFCDAVMTRIREYYPQIVSIEPHGDPREGFGYVRVRITTSA